MRITLNLAPKKRLPSCLLSSASCRLPGRLACCLPIFFAALAGAVLASRFSTAAAPLQRWNWRELTPSQGPAPEPRRNGTAIYDPLARRVVIFAGIGQSGFFNDLWAFDLAALSWTRLGAVGPSPAPRLGHNAVYDPAGNQMVVWAGQQGARFFNDTWTLDLKTLQWREVTPSVRPKARYGSASVFDSEERQLVQFAGFTEESGRFQDTQGFNLNSYSWTDLTPPGEKPQVRCLHTAALHRPLRCMIIYGGQRSGPLDDLWVFDLVSRSWIQMKPAERPEGRFFATSFVSEGGSFVVFGGATAAGNVNETWAFNLDTQRWTRLEIEGPPSRRNGMMGAYIETEDRFIIFGGTGDRLFNDVWELYQVRPRRRP